jgi:hypothetical protein
MTNKQILSLLALAKAYPPMAEEVIDQLYSLFDEVVEREKYHAWVATRSAMTAEEKQALLD